VAQQFGISVISGIGLISRALMKQHLNYLTLKHTNLMEYSEPLVISLFRNFIQDQKYSSASPISSLFFIRVQSHSIYNWEMHSLSQSA